MRPRTMTNEDTINDNDPISKEEGAIINAAFKLHEIVIRHRIYRRGRGRSQFTSAALEQARSALANLQPSVPGTNPIKVAAILAKNQNVASASVKLAIEEAGAVKRAMWDNIRATELDATAVKNLTEDAPIFKMFARAKRLDQTVSELRHDYIAPRIAHLASALASKVAREVEAATTEAEAA